MEALVQYFLSNVDKGLWTGFLALAVYFVLKKEPFRLVTYYVDRRDKHHEFARTLLDSNKLTEEANSFLRESLEKTAFSRYYGIRADARMRTGLIAIHEQHQDKITWVHIRRAYPYLRLMQGHVAVELRWFDHALRWLVTTLSFFTGAYSLLAIAVAVIGHKELGMSKFLGMTIFSFLLLGAAVYFAALNWPYHAALRVDRAIRSGNR